VGGALVADVVEALRYSARSRSESWTAFFALRSSMPGDSRAWRRGSRGAGDEDAEETGCRRAMLAP
jgi:hypothetical protein